jgi:hypothetical protein
MRTPRRFQYWSDPICVTCVIFAALNRYYLKPHRIGGHFTIAYLNDVICLPLFVPIILYIQRRLRVRLHDGYPRLWEILQNWAIFAILYKVILVRFPHVYRVARDPIDVIAYLAGGLAAWLFWKWRATKARPSPARRFNWQRPHGVQKSFAIADQHGPAQ